jgi:hypothetical protein
MNAGGARAHALLFVLGLDQGHVVMEPQFHQDQDGRDGERGLKLSLPILQAACRQLIREEAGPLDGIPDLRQLCTQADGLVHGEEGS